MVDRAALKMIGLTTSLQVGRDELTSSLSKSTGPESSPNYANDNNKIELHFLRIDKLAANMMLADLVDTMCFFEVSHPLFKS